jgi:teichuronic acid biosynthesis glycosyltransferase TuaG
MAITCQSPPVSIIMPCHNGALTLQESIRSALAQSYSNFELIIIDDCSTDCSLDLLRAFETKDCRVRVICNTRSLGAAAARNRGLENAHGRYVAFLDCDDIWFPDKLAIELSAMEQQNAALICAGYDVIDPNGRRVGRIHPTPGVLSYRSMLTYNSVGCLTAVIDRNICGDVRFSPALSTGEDYQLWLSILRRGLKGLCLADRLAAYRVQGTSLSGNKLAAARNRWRVYREFENCGFVESMMYFALYGISGIWKSLVCHGQVRLSSKFFLAYVG